MRAVELDVGGDLDAPQNFRFDVAAVGRRLAAIGGAR